MDWSVCGYPWIVVCTGTYTLPRDRILQSFYLQTALNWKQNGTPCISRVNPERNRAVQSSQLSWAGQYKKFVQYEIKFTSLHSNNWLHKSDTWEETCTNKKDTNDYTSIKILYVSFFSYWYSSWLSSLLFVRIGSVLSTFCFSLISSLIIL